MKEIEQGDVIKIERASTLFAVVSSDFFNRSGLVVVCPFVKHAAPDALHVPVQADEIDGVVLCEDLTSVSAVSRGFSIRGHLPSGSLLDVIYRVQSIFDFYQHAE